METSWYRTGGEILTLEFRKVECDKGKIVVEEQSLLQRQVLPAQSFSAGRSAETTTLFRNDVAEQASQDVLGYDQKKKNECYVKGLIISTTRAYV